MVEFGHIEVDSVMGREVSTVRDVRCVHIVSVSWYFNLAPIVPLLCHQGKLNNNREPSAEITAIRVT